MQTLLDKNEALRKQIKDLQSNIKELQNTPMPRRQNSKKNKNGKSMFGTLIKSTTQALNLKVFDDGEQELTPKQVEAVNEVHKMILDKKYDEVDSFVQEKKKLLFGKVKKGATLNPFDLKDEFGETVLMKAIKEGKQAMVMDLIDKGATIDVADKEGETPLMVAAKYGEQEIVKTMIPKANRDAKTKYSRKTALHYAAEQGHAAIVNDLLESGCDPLIEDSEGKNPYQVAKGREVKKILGVVMKKHDVPVPDETENADIGGLKDDETGDLLEKKERSYSQDEEMKPIFEENQQLEKRKQRLELQLNDLKQKRAPKNNYEKAKILTGKDKKEFLGIQDAPLNDLVKKFHDLVLRGNEQAALEEVEAMLTEKRKNMKVNKDAKDEFGETALMKASRLGYDEMVAFLLLYKCAVDAKDIEGYTALMKAAQFGKRECCVKLIAEGADINASSRNGKLTALMLAAQRGHGDICEMLIAEGADHSLLDSSGKKAVDLASNDEAKQIVEKAMEDHPINRKPVPI